MKPILALILILTITGCSHNVITYSDGIGLETTFRPDNGNFGISLRYGKILSAVLRENSELEMSGDGKTSSTEQSPSASLQSGLKVKIGRQITGYYVEALEAGATETKIDEYIANTGK